MVWAIDPDGTLRLDRGEYFIIPKDLRYDSHVVFMNRSHHVLYQLYIIQQASELLVNQSAEEMGLSELLVNQLAEEMRLKPNEVLLFSSLEGNSLQYSKFMAILAVLSMICQGAKIAKPATPTRIPSTDMPVIDVTLEWLEKVESHFAERPFDIIGDKELFYKLLKTAKVKAMAESL